ncbi:MAG TPA: hypothetical protein VHB99_10370 [Pirellulales bacterium]|nr:hypothetical protein [Pirellulales bacterium]
MSLPPEIDLDSFPEDLPAPATLQPGPGSVIPGLARPTLGSQPVCSTPEGEEEEFDEEDFDDDFDDDFEDELDEELNDDLDEFDEDIEEGGDIDPDADEDAAFEEEDF